MDHDVTKQHDPGKDQTPRRFPAVGIATGLGTLGVIASLSTAALAVVLWEGIFAAAILLAGTGLGLWIVRLIGLHRAAWRWQLLLGAGLGIGTLSLLVLLLGWLGVLDRSVWLGLLTLFGVTGLIRLTTILSSPPRENDAESSHNPRMRWLWLGLIIIAAFGFVGGTFPPGILWPAEGNGYDVLEYHLAVPREHLEAGEIAFLPHNVYSNLPMNVEMLYLLAMVLHGEPIAALFTAKLIHVWLAVLAVAAVWLAGRERGRESGIIAAVCFAATPFLAYLCGLAYVENGLLFYAALSIAAAMRMRSAPIGESGRWALAAGLLAGLACGCKYTAVPMLALPLALAASWRGATSQPRRLSLLPLFVLGCAMTLSPWLIKNAVMTGNPVFPLGRSLCHERAGVWNDDCAERWQRGHEPAPEERPISVRLQKLWRDVLSGKLFGAVFGLLAVAGVFAIIQALLFRRDVSALASDRGPPTPRVMAYTGVCWIVILVGTLVWTGWTHLVDRFALLLVVPATIVIGVTWASLRSKAARVCGLLAIVALLAINTLAVANLYTNHSFLVTHTAPVKPMPTADTAADRVAHIDFIKLNASGDNTLFTSGRWPFAPHVARLNELAKPDERVLMIGDARRLYLNENVDYCVTFSPFPFADVLARGSASDTLAWLQSHHYKHLYVDWTELQRFRKTRYGVWQGLPLDLRSHIEHAGLEPVEAFFFPNEQRPYSTLYRIPAESESRGGA